MLRPLVLALGFFSAGTALADTYAFTTLSFPNILDINYPGQNLYILEASGTVPTGINNNGLIVGQMQSNFGHWTKGPYGAVGFAYAGGNYYAFGSQVYSSTPSGGHESFQPAGVNDSGVVVGSLTDDMFFDSYGFSAGLPGLSGNYFTDISQNVSEYSFPNFQPGYGNTYFSGIDNAGDIIGNYNGYYVDANYNYIGFGGGFLLSGGNFIPLSYTPLAISSNGAWIVGLEPNGDIYTFDNTSQGTFIDDLGQLPFTPSGINDQGMIVGGDYLLDNGSLHQIHLQNVSSAITINAINDHDQMVGTYIANNGAEYGFEATTPEPAFLWMLVAGIAGLAIARRRASIARPQDPS